MALPKNSPAWKQFNMNPKMKNGIYRFKNNAAPAVGHILRVRKGDEVYVHDNHFWYDGTEQRIGGYINAEVYLELIEEVDLALYEIQGPPEAQSKCLGMFP